MTGNRFVPFWALVAAVLAVGCLPPRPDLPPPVHPFTRTPDAAFRQRPPTPEPVATGNEVRVPPIERYALDNGLVVFIVERGQYPLVASALVSATAGAASATARPGLAELTARCLVRGTRFPNGKVLRNLHVDRQEPEIDVLPESARLLLQTLPTATARAINLLAGVVRRPVFLADQMEVARWAQLEALRDQSNSLLGLMFPLGARLVYGDAHVLSADAREVATLTRQYTVSDVRRLHAQYYHPATTALVVVGDVTGAEVHGLAQAAFGDWAPPGPPPRPAALPKPARKSRKPGATIHLVYGGSANSYLLVLAPGPAHSAPDHEAAILFTKILGGMFESRAMTALRHRAGASYGAVAEVGALAEHGLLGFWSSVDRLRTPFAVEWLLEEATRLREELVSEDELSLARAERIAHLTDALSSNAETATLISRLFVAGHRDPAAYLRELPGRLARIRPEDVRAAARRYLDPERLDIIVWGSRSLHRRLSEIAHVEAYE